MVWLPCQGASEKVWTEKAWANPNITTNRIFSDMNTVDKSSVDQSTIIRPNDLNSAYTAPEIVKQRIRTLEALEIQTGNHILDIGCGTGFLTYDMARLTGEQGKVTAIDISDDMVANTLSRCEDLDQVSAQTGDICNLAADDGTMDVVTCTQVLLYVKEVEKAIEEMHRALKPGGRIAVLETDWRGMVMSGNAEITEKIIQAWDQTVASPNLPPRLPGLLRRQGFVGVRSEAIPLLNTSYSPSAFSTNSLTWMAKKAFQRGFISNEQGIEWVEEQKQLGIKGEYFFCVNRFLFSAVKS